MNKNDKNYNSIHGINKYINLVFDFNKPKLEEIQSFEKIFITFTKIINQSESFNEKYIIQQ